MVQRTEVVRAAEQRARQIIEAAETDARRLRHETEDFLDQRLGSFEMLLDKLEKTVDAGRERLSIGAPPRRGDDVDEDDPTKGFFDQDRLTHRLRHAAAARSTPPSCCAGRATRTPRRALESRRRPTLGIDDPLA